VALGHYLKTWSLLEGGRIVSARASVTVGRAREDVERLWQSSEYRREYIAGSGADVTFADAPGDRGTEVHVDPAGAQSGGKLAGLAKKVGRGYSLAKVKDDLRRFKQHVETGVIARSEGSPESERAERKLRQRPAQPLSDSELEKAGV
jgi:uncharacterized membrane protein